jgi:hypothetical protein
MQMISFSEGAWRANKSITVNAVVFEESPIIICPSDIPPAWKKLGKKISKLEPDRRPESTPDTLPPWEHVLLNEAIVKLVRAFDIADESVKTSVLEIYNKSEGPKDSPFESLIKKAKQTLIKEAPKIGITKRTTASLDELLQILTTKVCVTLEGSAVLFRNLGTIPHHCAPNCMFIPRANNTAQLIAIRDIEAGEAINCSHIPTNCLRANVETRQSWLRGIAGSRCRGSCCNAGFDLRRRVLCRTCYPLDSTNEIESLESSQICYAARDNNTGIWKGLICGTETEEAQAIDVSREASLVKKILILNETDVDIPRLTLYTNAAIRDALKYFGKGHFCYHQLLLLNCGLALHSLCELSNSAGASVSEGQKKSFGAWVRMLGEVVEFSSETELPFQGMDELVRIILAPETLQMAVKLMGATKKSESQTVEIFRIFSEYVEQSCACLVLIEGEASVHSQDGIKLKNWWIKKHKSWLNAPEKVEPVVVATSEVKSEVIVTPSTVMVKKSVFQEYGVQIALGSTVILSGIALVSYYRRNRN